jgi:hypothetical protein
VQHESLRWFSVVIAVTVWAACSSNAGDLDARRIDTERRVQELEHQLNAVGADRFQVHSLEVTGHEVVGFNEGRHMSGAATLEDRLVFHRLSFRADIEILTPFIAGPPVPEEGEPNLSFDVVRRRAALMALFGRERLVAGQRRSVEAIGVFDVLQPGWRFRAFVEPGPVPFLPPFEGAVLLAEESE